MARKIENNSEQTNKEISSHVSDLMDRIPDPQQQQLTQQLGPEFLGILGDNPEMLKEILENNLDQEGS